MKRLQPVDPEIFLCAGSNARLAGAPSGGVTAGVSPSATSFQDVPARLPTAATAWGRTRRPAPACCSSISTFVGAPFVMTGYGMREAQIVWVPEVTETRTW